MRKYLMTADAATSLVLLAATGWQVLMREWYHRTGEQTTKVLLWFGCWMALMLLTTIGPRLLPTQFHTKFSRGVLLITTTLSAYFLIGGVIWATMIRAELSRYWLVLGIILLLALVFLVKLAAVRLRLSWVLLRKVIFVSAVFFTVSQPILVTILRPNINWPLTNQPTASQPEADARSATIFLLLDEMNASSAAPFVDMLKGHGLKVEFKGIKPVADATAKVIPAMFSGQDFKQARPCGLTAICSGFNILDFSHIRANRADIDVVGFYHPYCSIQGLRWCHNLDDQISLLEESWGCVLSRGAIWLAQPTSRCSKLNLEIEGQNRPKLNKIAEALWLAPFWREGGFLFAHLPLPHPPGVTAGATLQMHYADNVLRAIKLVSEIVVRARRVAPNDTRLVIFSDHPLRQALWCRIYEPYAAQGCVSVMEFEDTQVPLIVAGDHFSSIDQISNNAQVFRLADRQ